ncbi:hypothetical protein MAM1_0046c03150 [Mucor ambiguus]|uniref:Uncharacterized protein n=1 Tax=Mucor ambiguus TaxID=91626 RepID=A0A0C9LTF1_9FUNG|nr:hypothetical protein MAM1_0046c03150 [Mucor ambiguus]
MIKVCGHVNIPLNIATNVSFEDENEGDIVDIKADDNSAADAGESKVINNGHAMQEATDNVTLPPTAKYNSQIWIHLRPDFSR